MHVILGPSLCRTRSPVMRKKIIFIFIVKSFKNLSHAVVENDSSHVTQKKGVQ